MAKIKLSNTKVEQIKAICKEFNNNKGINKRVAQNT